MFEIAVRVKELASSNLNHLVDAASSPAKMLKLLQLELEEAIIALTGDATRAQRSARDAAARADAHAKAAVDWQDKAKLALTNDRTDLARAALGEKDNSATAADNARQTASDCEAEHAALSAVIADLEAKLAETRERLRSELAKNAAATGNDTRTASSRSNGRVDAMTDRIAVLEKRIDFAEAGSASSTRAASLDQELAAMQREAQLDAELAALKKGIKKGK